MCCLFIRSVDGAVLHYWWNIEWQTGDGGGERLCIDGRNEFDYYNINKRRHYNGKRI